MAFWDGYRWIRPTTTPREQRRRFVDWVATAVLLVGLAMIALVSSDTQATGPTVRLDPAEGPPGLAVTATISGFPSNAQVVVTFDGDSVHRGKLRTDKTGELQVSFAVPEGAPGERMVAAHARVPGASRRGGAGQDTSATAAFERLSADRAPAPAPVTAAPTATPADATAGGSQSASPTNTPSAEPTTSTAPATPVATSVPSRTPAPTPVPTAVPTVAPTPPPTPPPATDLNLLFGLGPTIDSSRDAQLTRESNVDMLTAWYNGPNDLGWMTDAYHRGMYASEYADGKALHLVVWTGDAETSFSTAYGTACGRAYPLSSRFLNDIKQVAGAFSGSGTLYVTLFTEFQTFPCTDNAWNPNAATNAYLRALKDRYLEARSAIRSVAPNAKVSLGWGGWQTRWDDAAKGGGRSMFQYFADVMRASDFQSFQAMQSDTNVGDVRAMTRTLGAYGPVMLAHHKPNNSSQSTFDADVRAMLTESYLAEMRGYGLFAWSFMDQANLTGSSYSFVRDALIRFGR